MDRHSRTLVQSHGRSGPQALILKALQQSPLDRQGTGGRRVSLSLGTVTAILNRLEQRSLIKRVSEGRTGLPTDAGRGDQRGIGLAQVILAVAAGTVRGQFRQTAGLGTDYVLLASLQRVAATMEAERIDASPVLSSGSRRASAETVEEILEPRGERETGHKKNGAWIDAVFYDLKNQFMTPNE